MICNFGPIAGELCPSSGNVRFNRWMTGVVFCTPNINKPTVTGDATTHQFSILQRGTALLRAWNHGVQTLLGGGLLGCRGVFVEIPMVSHGFPWFPMFSPMKMIYKWWDIMGYPHRNITLEYRACSKVRYTPNSVHISMWFIDE